MIVLSFIGDRWVHSYAVVTDKQHKFLRIFELDFQLAGRRVSALWFLRFA
jgi:hypothetical protein